MPQPLAEQRDQLTGLHANTQIPKVIGCWPHGRTHAAARGRRAAEFFWHTVVDKRSVAIGGNSVREHFHPADDFKPMVDDVEGPETCNSYNMLSSSPRCCTAQPARAPSRPAGRLLRAHVSTTTSSPRSTQAVLFTSRRCGRSTTASTRRWTKACGAAWVGIESHARHGEFVYSNEGADKFFVNLFVASSVDWRERSPCA